MHWFSSLQLEALESLNGIRDNGQGRTSTAQCLQASSEQEESMDLALLIPNLGQKACRNLLTS